MVEFGFEFEFVEKYFPHIGNRGKSLVEFRSFTVIQPAQTQAKTANQNTQPAIEPSSQPASKQATNAKPSKASQLVSKLVGR